MTSKKLLRDAARTRRAELAKAIPDFAERLAGHAAALNIPPNSLIGAYAALPGEADPHLLLKALDSSGHRLGYGGGYYDRTLEMLRAHGSIRTIGIAYAGQEIDAVPDENHD